MESNPHSEVREEIEQIFRFYPETLQHETRYEFAEENKEDAITAIVNLLLSKRQEWKLEGKRTALEVIAKGEGWEESKTHYEKELGLAHLKEKP